MVSNEVNHQSSTSVVAKSVASNPANTNSTNEQQQQSSSQGQNANNRTQDDAIGSYVFQRPNDTEYPPYAKSSRWFGTEDGNLINVSLTFIFAFSCLA